MCVGGVEVLQPRPGMREPSPRASSTLSHDPKGPLSHSLRTVSANSGMGGVWGARGVGGRRWKKKKGQGVGGKGSKKENGVLK